MKQVKRIGLPALTIVLALVVAQMLIAGREELTPRSVETQAPLVEVLDVNLAPVAISVTSYGTVESPNRLILTSDVTGRVETVSPAFRTGHWVAAGEPLLSIDDSQYRLALQQAELAAADAELALAEELARLGLKEGSRAAQKARQEHPRVVRAVAQSKAARAQLDKARQDLERTRVVAPFDAVVVSRQATAGQYVVTAGQLGVLLDASHAEITVSLPADQLRWMREDASLSVRIRQPGRDAVLREGRLDRVHKQLDEQTRVARLVVRVDDPYGRQGDGGAQTLRFGQFVETQIDGLVVNNAVRIPRQALFGQSTVYVLDDQNQLRRKQVSVARSEGDAVVVDGGLQSGDRVVLTRLSLMADGSPVRVQDASAGQGA